MLGHIKYLFAYILHYTYCHALWFQDLNLYSNLLLKGDLVVQV